MSKEKISKLEEILGVLAGHSSLCWNPKPKGVFDSTEANKGVEEAKQQILSLLLTEEDVLEISKDYEEVLFTIDEHRIQGAILIDEFSKAITTAYKERLM